MFKKGWKYLSPDDDPAPPPADPPADPPPSDPPADPPPSDPPAAKWQDNWREMYAGEDKKKLERLGRYSTPAAAFDALFGLQAKIGSGELRSVLPKDATPEQMKQWREENGIPEKPEDYGITFGKDGLPEQDKPMVDKFLSAMHSKNANKDQATTAINTYYELVAEQTAARHDQDREFAKQSEDHLRAEWGQEYRANINMINGLLATAPAEVQDLIKGGRLANGDPFMSHPHVLQWMNGMARQINPVTTLIPNAGANMASAIDDEIKAIEKLMAANSPDYWKDDKKQSRYRELLAARDKLSAKP